MLGKYDDLSTVQNMSKTQLSSGSLNLEFQWPMKFLAATTQIFCLHVYNLLTLQTILPFKCQATAEQENGEMDA